jgi:hypothetical protein
MFGFYFEEYTRSSTSDETCLRYFLTPPAPGTRESAVTQSMPIPPGFQTFILGIEVLIHLRLVFQVDPKALEKMAFARMPADNIDISSKPPKPSKERHLSRSPSANMSTANGPGTVSHRLKQLEVQSESRLYAWRIRQYGM